MDTKTIIGAVVIGAIGYYLWKKSKDKSSSVEVKRPKTDKFGMPKVQPAEDVKPNKATPMPNQIAAARFLNKDWLNMPQAKISSGAWLNIPISMSQQKM